MNKLNVIIIFVVSVQLSGCSALSFNADTWKASLSISGLRAASQSDSKLQAQSLSELQSNLNSDAQTYKRSKAEILIAQDFINAIIQFEFFVPWSTVLYFKPPAERPVNIVGSGLSHELYQKFGMALREVAVQRGYALQYVDDMGGTSVIEYGVYPAIQARGVDAAFQFIFEVNVSGVGFRRMYSLGASGTVRPIQAMQIRGADAAGVVPDDSIFTDQLPVAKESSILANTNPMNKPEIGFTSPLARKVQVLPNIDKPVLVEKTLPSVVNSVMVQKQNLADSKVSNFESLLAKKEEVVQQTLVFSNDSFVMGSYNKSIVDDVMAQFNADTDVVSVVGCSTGKTNLENGNAALAIGRANRVKEAFLYRGVSHDKILDEGCWSPTANSTPFPNRGVVITVKRGGLIDSGG